jgi:hypothetical protein
MPMFRRRWEMAMVSCALADMEAEQAMNFFRRMNKMEMKRSSVLCVDLEAFENILCLAESQSLLHSPFENILCLAESQSLLHSPFLH